ncbi:MAG: aminoacyltransferase [Bacteroidales bacterium]|jgi:hypothetical protein|nr:aminoacyltransferase [Bacteroidales bacterium]
MKNNTFATILKFINSLYSMDIKHLSHNEINREKWDACIKNACNSLVYAESWYLDTVSPKWEALICGDYEYVMPLPVKKKYGISFLVQPPLTQQLGIFSSKKIDKKMVESFIKKIPYFSYHLCLNEQNPFCNGSKQLNFILNLNNTYDTLSSSYSKNMKRNLKKAIDFNIEIKTDLLPIDFFHFYNSVEKSYPVAPNRKVYSLVENSFGREKITLYGAYSSNNELISALCLLHSSQRLIYLLPVSNPEGKEKLAMFRIVDSIIHNYANQNFILDFEGSNVESVAKIYQGFGAQLQTYFQVKRWSINDFGKYLY